MTSLDPSLTKADSLSGSLAGVGLPDVYSKIIVKTKMSEKLLTEDQKIDPIKVGEPLMLNVGTARTIGIVKTSKKDNVEFDLKLPICAEKNDRIVVSRRIGDRWRLIGWGTLI